MAHWPVAGRRQLQPELLEGPKRQVQAQRLRREGREAVACMEGAGAVVQRIDHDGIDADGVARADDPMDRVEQQDIAEPAPLAAKIDGQPPDDGCRYGIVRQAPGERRRQVVLFEARRGQRVSAGDPFGRIARRDKDPRDATPGITRSLPANVPVERWLPAGERRAVVVRTERLDRQRRLIQRGARGSVARPASAPRSARAG